MDVLCRVDRADDRDAADAAARELRDIFLRNAADGDNGDGHGPADGLERLIAHIVGVVLRAGREHRADAEVIRAVLFGQDGLLHGLGGDAQNLVRAQNRADVLRLHIALADMHAVCVHLAGDLDVVIHKERHTALAAERLQLLRFLEELPLLQRLFAQLDHRHAAVQAFANGVTSIGEYAFSGCTSVHSIDLSSIAQATYGDNAFASMSTKLIYVDNLTQKSTVESTQGFTSSVFAITNGGTFAENAIFEEGKLATPEKAGYTFDGWYENADFTGEAVTTPVQRKTYYAKWTKNKYTVTLDNNGHGEQPAAISPVEYGASVTDYLPELSDSTSEWVFDGWYMDENFTTKYDKQAITDNTTLYAKWHEYQNTSLTAKVSKSNYLVNTPADVNVTVTPGDDIKDLKQNVNNIKISLTYDDDVTSVMLNGEVLDKKEYTISDLMQRMGQNRKLDVTYGKAGTHTFGIVLKNGDKIVSECSTDIVVVEKAAELTPATKLYTLTVKNADVTIKNGDEEIKAEKNDKGELIAKVPEKADVTVTYTSQSDAVAFDQWTITTDETLDVDVKNNPLKFQMPAGGVTIEAMTKDASIEEDEPNILGTAAVVGTAAAGMAGLPAGHGAVPENRSARRYCHPHKPCRAGPAGVEPCR